MKAVQSRSIGPAVIAQGRLKATFTGHRRGVGTAFNALLEVTR
jgi:hypothetical protein